MLKVLVPKNRTLQFGLLWLPIAVLWVWQAWAMRDYFFRPAWRDEPSYLFEELLKAKDLSFFLPWNYKNPMGHPPLHPFLLWVGKKIFGNWVLSGTLLSFLSAIASLGAITMIARDLCRTEDKPASFASSGIMAAWVATFLVASFPVFIGISVAVLADMPMLALGLWGIWFTYKKQYWAALAFLSVTILLRESGLAFVAAACALVFADRKGSPKRFLAVGVPIALLGIHFLLSRLTKGMWLTHPFAWGGLAHIEVSFFDLSGKWNSFLKMHRHILNNTNLIFKMSKAGYILFYGSVAMALVWLLWLKGHRKMLMASLLISSIAIVVFFVLYVDHVARDFLPFFATVAISFGVLMGRLFGKLPFVWVGPPALALLFFWVHGSTVSTLARQPTLDPLPNMKTIRFLKQELGKLEACCGDRDVTALYPVRASILVAESGYVDKAIKVSSNLRWAEIAVIFSGDVILKGDITPAIRLEAFKKVPGRVLWRTEQDDKWFVVYEFEKKRGTPLNLNFEDLKPDLKN